MTGKEYPFALQKAFFIQIEIGRTPDLSDQPEFSISYQVKLHQPEDHPRRLQVNVRATSDPESRLSFTLELVAFFECLTEAAAQDKKQIIEYLESRGLFMLTPQITQLLSLLTSQMGIHPLAVVHSMKFSLEELKENLESAD